MLNQLLWFCSITLAMGVFQDTASDHVPGLVAKNTRNRNANIRNR